MFERSLALVGTLDDSLLVVPWLMTADVSSGGVARTARGLVLRGSEWEEVFGAEWEDPPTRSPWRILPHGEMRILVGMDDAVERIVYDAAGRRLELAPGISITEWTGPRGGTYRLREGSARVGERMVEGFVLDVSRSAASSEPPHGDWAFLVSGDSLQVVLHSPRPEEQREPAAGGAGEAWRGWARLDFRELRWPVLTVEWTGTRAFEQARRDVPVAWRIRSPGDEVTGELSAWGTQVVAGEGEGPQLPVSGLFGVHGTLVIEGAEYPVTGLLHHTQG